MYVTLLIPMFCKNNAFYHIRRKEAVVHFAFFFNVLLIVVMNCFFGIRFSQLYCLS